MALSCIPDSKERGRPEPSSEVPGVSQRPHLKQGPAERRKRELFVRVTYLVGHYFHIRLPGPVLGSDGPRADPAGDEDFPAPGKHIERDGLSVGLELLRKSHAADEECLLPVPAGEVHCECEASV